jgi:hypothetical protein
MGPVRSTEGRSLPRPASRRRAVEAGLLGVLVCLAATRFLPTAWWRGELAELLAVFLRYKAATLAVDFVDFGAVPRGLAGTLARLLASDPADAALRLHVVGAVAAATVLAALFATLRAPGVRRAAAAAVAVALALRWGGDAGRTDLLVVAVLGAATLAWTSGHRALAALAVGAGTFVHETGALFGVPLLAALAWRDGAGGRRGPQGLGAPVAVLAVCLAAYAALPWLPHAPDAAIAARVHARMGRDEAVDAALYFALAGWRGVRAAMCQNARDPLHAVHVASGLVAIALAAVALAPGRGEGRRTALLAALPGYAVLVVVANDHARWTLLACATVWLVAVSARRAASAAPPPASRADLAGAAAAALLLLALAVPGGPDTAPVVAPVPRLDAWLARPAGPRPGFADVIARCDADWRDVLGRPADAPR